MNDSNDKTTRQEEIASIWRNNQYLYIIVGFVFGVLFFPALSVINVDFRSFLQSLVPEFAGIAFTVLLIDSLIRRREKESADREAKERLISDLSLNTNVFAKRAASILWRRGWLQDGSIRNMDLEAANLEGAYLRDGDFTGSDLHYANLKGANLRNARLIKTDLRSADLTHADLRGAELTQARIYSSTLLNTQTIMPNGSFWSSNTDWDEYGAIFIDLKET